MSIKSTFLSAVKAAEKTVSNILPAKKPAPPIAPPPPPGAKNPGPDPEAPVLLLAWRAPSLNTQLLVAYKPGTDPNNPNNLVTVQVRANHNFLPGMKLRVQHVEGTIYNLVGPLPRWRGRY